MSIDAAAAQNVRLFIPCSTHADQRPEQDPAAGCGTHVKRPPSYQWRQHSGSVHEGIEFVKLPKSVGDNPSNTAHGAKHVEESRHGDALTVLALTSRYNTCDVPDQHEKYGLTHQHANYFEEKIFSIRQNAFSKVPVPRLAVGEYIGAFDLLTPVEQTNVDVFDFLCICSLVTKKKQIVMYVFVEIGNIEV